MKTNHITSTSLEQVCPVVDTKGNPLTAGQTYMYQYNRTEVISWEGSLGDGEYIAVHYTDRSRWGPTAVAVIAPTTVENPLTEVLEEVYQSQFKPVNNTHTGAT